MIGITCALYDEAYELISQLDRVKTNGLKYYCGQITGKDITVFLTRPGLKKNKKNFIKWLESFSFSKIIVTGFCGGLSNRFSVGDVCAISSAIDSKTKTLYETGIKNGQSIVTVAEPVLTLSGREDLRIAYDLDLVDMESSIICHILKKNFPQIPFAIIKVIGDIPGEDDLMRNEVQMRAFFSTHSILRKLAIALKTGKTFLTLYRRKRNLQKILKKTVESEITGLK